MWIELYSLRRLTSLYETFSGPILHESQNPDYSKAQTIAILSHGGQGSIEWEGGSWDGAKLVNDELLVEGHEIKSGSILELWSCSAGEETPQGNDSLVHAVQKTLIEKGVPNISVRGVKGMHLVLNDLGDHYIPKVTDKVDEEGIEEIFIKLRAYYLWLFGYFSLAST